MGVAVHCGFYLKHERCYNTRYRLFVIQVKCEVIEKINEFRETKMVERF